jgi:hypothetical protein
MKIRDFCLFFWVIFALLDTDPATQINADPSGLGSGSETLMVIGFFYVLQRYLYRTVLQQ